MKLFNYLFYYNIKQDYIYTYMKITNNLKNNRLLF